MPNVEDEERYQTVYAREFGSAAAPTAGLHLTPKLLDRIRSRGIDVQCVTLHVGAGTFQPVRTERLEDHHMHEESVVLSSSAATAIETARTEGRDVIAVGTTVVRALESRAIDECVSNRELTSGEWRTDLFSTRPSIPCDYTAPD